MTVKTYTVQDGETLSGTLFRKTQINTAATEEDSEPITVTLDGVDIACNNDYPGINCQGNTNLVLADGSVNHVTANEPRYAGIGCGFNAGKNETKARATCGDFTITSSVTSVTATKRGNSPNSIGRGATNGGAQTCGIVTIGCTLDDEGDPVGGTTGEISTSPYTYQP